MVDVISINLRYVVSVSFTRIPNYGPYTCMRIRAYVIVSITFACSLGDVQWRVRYKPVRITLSDEQLNVVTLQTSNEQSLRVAVSLLACARWRITQCQVDHTVC